MKQLKTLLLASIVALITTFANAVPVNMVPIISYLLSDSETSPLNTLAGKTLYTTIYDIPNTLESWTYNADMTSATWVEIVGGTDSGTGTLSVDGMTMIYTEGVETNTIVVTEILEDYLLVSVEGGAAQRLYFEEAKARAYFLGLEGLLAGNTLYTTFYDITNTLESWTFNAGMTSVTWIELIGGNGDSGTETLSVDGMTMIVAAGTVDSGTIVVTEILADYMLISIDGEAAQRLYFDEDKARTYFLGSAVVPTKTISSNSDWNDIDTIYSDPVGDAAMSGLDITSIKMAQDNTNLYINLDRAGLAFPSSDYYYNYWIYFRAGDDTFSLENFHDGQGNYRYIIYKGIGYQGGTVISEIEMSANTTSSNLNLVVPKANLINENADYAVTLFTHGFKEGLEDILGEKEEDSYFNIKLTQ